MTSTKPYLIRAFYEWIADNHLTPHVVIDTRLPGVKVPPQYAKAGQLTLNISARASHQLVINNEWIEFSARFSGVSQLVSAPMAAILGIYAKENGRGMAFSPEDEEENGGSFPPLTSTSSEGSSPHKKPTLTIIKK